MTGAATTALWDTLHATPVATSSPEIVLLGSSGFSAQLAGLLGLPFAFAHHFDIGTAVSTLDAANWYRAHFTPSAVLDAPYFIVTAGVLAADTAEQAEHLAGPARLAMLAMRTGRRLALLSPEQAAAHPDIETARAMPSNRIVGDPETVANRLDELVVATEADEVMVSTMTYGLAERVRTLEVVAAISRRPPLRSPATQAACDRSSAGASSLALEHGFARR